MSPPKGSLSVLIGRSAGCVSPRMPAGTFSALLTTVSLEFKKKKIGKRETGDKSRGRKQHSGREKLSSEGGESGEVREGTGGRCREVVGGRGGLGGRE